MVDEPESPPVFAPPPEAPPVSWGFDVLSWDFFESVPVPSDGFFVDEPLDAASEDWEAELLLTCEGSV